MEEFAEKFAIPLVHQIGQSDLLGTACVVSANERHYLLSAGHVLKILKEHPEDVGVRWVRPEPWQLRSGMVCM